MENSSKRILFLYEPEQVFEIDRYLKVRSDDTRVVALDLWVERACLQKGVSFESVSSCISSHEDTNELLSRIRSLAHGWYRLQGVEFFTYEDISLGEIFEPLLEAYLSRLFYYIRILDRVVAKLEGVQEILIPYSIHSSNPEAGPLAPFEMRAVVDAAVAVGKKYNLTVETLGSEPSAPNSHLYPASGWATIFFKAYNALVSLAPSRDLKIFASEYWSHIAPVLPKMADAELVLMERNEIRRIPPALLWKHRIRFMHPLDLMNRVQRKIAKRLVHSFTEDWKSVTEIVGKMDEWGYEGIACWDAAAPAFKYLVTSYVERVIVDAQVFQDVVRREGINRILLRASVGGRLYHFMLLTKIARLLKIPSIELQHAGAVADPKSVHSLLTADYLASYGLRVRELYVQNHGYQPEQIVPIGSPRFDEYIETYDSQVSRRMEILEPLGLDPERPVLLFVVPPEVVGILPLDFDSYERDSFFKAILATCKEIPQIQIIFKFRPKTLTAEYRAYMNELCAGNSFVLAEHENLFSLLCASTLVVSGSSTVIYEALLAKKPVVLFPWKESDYDLKTYSWVGPAIFSSDTLISEVRRLIEDSQYYQKRVSDSRRFLSEKYAFDGHAAERTVQLLRTANNFAG